MTENPLIQQATVPVSVPMFNLFQETYNKSARKHYEMNMDLTTYTDVSSWCVANNVDVGRKSATITRHLKSICASEQIQLLPKLNVSGTVMGYMFPPTLIEEKWEEALNQETIASLSLIHKKQKEEEFLNSLDPDQPVVVRVDTPAQ